MKIGEKSIEKAIQLVKDLMWANKENIDRANLYASHVYRYVR